MDSTKWTALAHSTVTATMSSRKDGRVGHYVYFAYPKFPGASTCLIEELSGSSWDDVLDKALARLQEIRLEQDRE
jgi:hypothetical protein